MHPKSDAEISLRARGIEWLIVIAYLDETNVPGAPDRLTAVAGYLFAPEGVTEFERRYRATVEPMLPLDKHGQKVFHANKCLTTFGYDQFEKMSADDREEIARRLVAALIPSVTMGAVVGVLQQDYDDGLSGRFARLRTAAVPDDHALAKVVGSKYSVCLIRCVQLIADWMDQKDLSGDVEYVFEAGCSHSAQAHLLLSRLITIPHLKKRYRMRDFAFADKGPQHPWLAAADYFAWEWQRYDQNSSQPHRGEWRETIFPLIEAKPHVPAYLSGQSVAVQAIVNTANNLLRVTDEF